MNKFTIVALCALAAIANVSAQFDDAADTFSQGSKLVTTDESEIENLPENQQIFADFCLSSRDYVFSQIRGSADATSAATFGSLFGLVQSIGQDAMNTLNEGTQKLSASLKDPNAAIDDGETPESKIIAEGQSRISGESQPNAFFTAIKTVVGAASRTLQDRVSQTLEDLKKKVGLGMVTQALNEACRKVREYENKIKSDFDEQQKALNVPGVTFENLKCVTAGRIARIEGFCNLVSAAAPGFTKIIKH